MMNKILLKRQNSPGTCASGLLCFGDTPGFGRDLDMFGLGDMDLELTDHRGGDYGRQE